MSWSINFIGKPENVTKALEEHSAKLDGQSKVEYDDALPHLIGLVKQTFGSQSPMMNLKASGHGYSDKGEQVSRQLSCNIESHYGTIV